MPGKLVSATTALGNLIMIHGFSGYPMWMNCSWTLEIELLFYCGMFVCTDCAACTRSTSPCWRCWRCVWDISRWIDCSASNCPGKISYLLILKHIPWFALGISVYLGTASHEVQRRKVAALTAASALLTLLIVDSVFLAALAGVLGTSVFLAASGRANLLRHPILAWLGAISYPLYLLHENIGWSVQLMLKEFGMPTDGHSTTLATALLMATALTRYIEQPAMRWIRNSYRNSQSVTR